MHALLGLGRSLVRWTLGRVPIVGTMWRDQRGALPGEDGATIGIDRWDGQRFTTAGEDANVRKDTPG